MVLISCYSKNNATGATVRTAVTENEFTPVLWIWQHCGVIFNEEQMDEQWGPVWSEKS